MEDCRMAGDGYRRWHPAETKEGGVAVDRTSERLHAAVCGHQVSDFCEEICSKFNLPKKVALEMLRSVESKGYIQIYWQSRGGARFTVITKGRRSYFSSRSSRKSSSCDIAPDINRDKMGRRCQLCIKKKSTH